MQNNCAAMVARKPTTASSQGVPHRRIGCITQDHTDPRVLGETLVGPLPLRLRGRDRMREHHGDGGSQEEGDDASGLDDQWQLGLVGHEMRCSDIARNEDHLLPGGRFTKRSSPSAANATAVP